MVVDAKVTFEPYQLVGHGDVVIKEGKSTEMSANIFDLISFFLEPNADPTFPKKKQEQPRPFNMTQRVRLQIAER